VVFAVGGHPSRQVWRVGVDKVPAGIDAVYIEEVRIIA